MRIEIPRRGDCRGHTFKAKQFAFSTISALLPPGFSPGDVDGCIELKSEFLFFELKPKGTVMPRGQYLLFRRLVDRLGGKSVLFVVNHRPGLQTASPGVDDVYGFGIFAADGVEVSHPKCTADTVCWWVEQWVKYAEGGESMFSSRLAELVSTN